MNTAKFRYQKMIDRIKFIVNLGSEKEGFLIAEKNNLLHCTEGNKVYFKSNLSGRFEGVSLTIKDGKVTLSCSLHSIYYRQHYGKLDNSGFFSMKLASSMAVKLLDDIGLDRRKTRITSYEVGLNMQMIEEPIKYIEAIQSVECKGECGEMFNDANYKKNRQKTTEKSKHIRRYFKIYDKDFQMFKEKQIPISGKNILRIETVCSRQSIMFNDLFNTKNLKELKNRFFSDWDSVAFERVLSFPKGTKKSVRDKAHSILLNGKDVYLSDSKALCQSGKLSKMEMRTIREFCAKWDSVKDSYSLVYSGIESEFRRKVNACLIYL